MDSNARQNILIALVILAAVFVSYSSALNAGFVWDDEFLVVSNPLVRAPIWSFQAFKQDIVNSSFRYSVYYRPVQITSYAFDRMIWGTSSFGYHLVNILLHFANSFLVFLLAFRISRNKLTGLLAGLFFAVHPQQVGAVSFISGRADLLFCFFGFLYMLFFLQDRGPGRKASIAISTIFLALSLLSKESAVIFPFLMLMVGAVAFRGEFPPKRYVPGFAAVLAYFVLRVFVLKAGVPGIFAAGSFLKLFHAYAAVAERALVQIFFPAALHFRSIGGWDLNIAILALSALLAAGLIFFLKNERRILLTALAFFFVAAIPPAISYARFGVFAEQWMYLPSVGLFLFVAAALSGFCVKKRYIPVLLAGALILSAIAFFAGSTRAYNVYWKDSSSLSERVLSFSPEDSTALYYKALGEAKAGGASVALDVMRSAREDGEPDAVQFYLKGRMALAAGETGEAEEDFTKALALRPDYDDGYVGMAFVSFVKGEETKGAFYLEKALSMNRANSEALLILSKYYLTKAQAAVALATIKKAERIYPYNYEVLTGAGDIYAATGNMRESARYYLKASRFYPERPEAYFSLARIFLASGDPHEALNWAQKSVKADPQYTPAIELIQKIKSTGT